jgi:hypothetical protein
MAEKWLKNEFITHAPVTIYPSEKQVIDNIFLGPNFPWFWHEIQTTDPREVTLSVVPKEYRSTVDFYNGPFLSHILLSRTEVENVNHTDRTGKDISTYWEFFLEIFHRFMTEHNLKYTNIFRANLNLTWYNGDLYTAPHLDHTWPHSNFIMYLSECTGGETIVWTDDFSTMYEIPPIQYSAVTFERQYHAHRYPRPTERRLVFVVTYV